jgi:hypothetical protein
MGSRVAPDMVIFTAIIAMNSGKSGVEETV